MASRFVEAANISCCVHLFVNLRYLLMFYFIKFVAVKVCYNHCSNCSTCMASTVVPCLILQVRVPKFKSAVPKILVV